MILFEVISSEDMLYRIENLNKKLEEYNNERKGTEGDWREDYMLLGSDVTTLFPSLSAEKTAKCVRSQILKMDIEWENIDTRWLCLYIHLSRHLCSDV